MKMLMMVEHHLSANGCLVYWHMKDYYYQTHYLHYFQCYWVPTHYEMSRERVST